MKKLLNNRCLIVSSWLEKFIKLSLLFISLSCLPITHAQITFNAARITAVDSLSVAEFYKEAFGMHEVERINLPNGEVEIMLNFGATQAEAIANTNAEIVVMPRTVSQQHENVAHVIFTVTNIQDTFLAATAAGAGVVREPFEFGNTGIWIAMIADPDGNQIELLQYAK
jgi:predicted enzyme related to lactoylglutathione lyase